MDLQLYGQDAQDSVPSGAQTSSTESEARLLFQLALIELQIQNGDWQAFLSSVVLGTEIHYGARRDNKVSFKTRH